jgi:hypothetical protein
MAKYNQNIQVKEDEMGRAYREHGEKRKAYRILVGEAIREDTIKKT